MAQQATERTLERWVREYENDPEFIANELSTDVIEDALRLLQEKHHTQTWLANAMGVSRSHVSNLFNATPNLTLFSIARLGVALGVKPKVILDSRQWFIIQMPQTGDLMQSYEEIKTDLAIARSGADSTLNVVPSGRPGGTADATT